MQECEPRGNGEWKGIITHADVSTIYGKELFPVVFYHMDLV